MNLPDLINGAFEAAAGLAILGHCLAILRDRAVAGVSIPSVIFFTAWGAWNLFFYPHLGQFWSFVGGIVVMLANVAYVLLLLRFRRTSA